MGACKPQTSAPPFSFSQRCLIWFRRASAAADQRRVTRLAEVEPARSAAVAAYLTQPPPSAAEVAERARNEQAAIARHRPPHHRLSLWVPPLRRGQITITHAACPASQAQPALPPQHTRATTQAATQVGAWVRESGFTMAGSEVMQAVSIAGRAVTVASGVITCQHNAGQAGGGSGVGRRECGVARRFCCGFGRSLDMLPTRTNNALKVNAGRKQR